MQQLETADFLRESEELHRALAGLDENDFRMVTQFKGWTLNDVLVHLHFWNCAADTSVTDPTAFALLVQRVIKAFERQGGLRELENAEISERGPALHDAWMAKVRSISEGWQKLDPKTRLPWVGVTMSARSSITARQMETWAHGSEVFDVLGLVREESDRIRNIVILGVNTFGWSHQVHGLPVPDEMPRLKLTAPSGAVWEFGEDSAGLISGTAIDFAAVVTQTRNLADTQLRVSGKVAETWMANAQCFAGPPETPPAPGTRSRIPGNA